MFQHNRLVAAGAGLALTFSGVLIGGSAHAAVDDRPARSAVSWLLANGMKTSPNPGLAGDTLLAMHEIDPEGYAADIVDVAEYVASKITPVTPGPALAKATVVLQAAGHSDAAPTRPRLGATPAGHQTAEHSIGGGRRW